MAQLRSRLGAVTAVAVMGALTAAGTSSAALAADQPAEAGITVPKVEGMGEDWINGVDVSSVLSLEESGVVFRDDAGDPGDLFEILADHGVNWVRVRVWNDPYNAEGQGYGAGNVDADRATEIAERATDAGMQVLVNFHYSDFWAHPGQQILPKAWSGDTLDEIVTDVHDYTAATLTQMADAGVDVGMVQVGNETTGGQIAGTTSNSSWSDTSQIFQAGSTAVREVYPDAKVAVHFTNPERGAYPGYAQRLADNGVDYDVFLSSYYPYWHGTLENLTSTLSEVATTFDKEVAVAEVSWAHTLEDGDGHTNVIYSDYDQYSTSVQGQALAVRDVMQAVANVDEGRGIGTFYWEPAWLPVGPADQVDANAVLWEQYGSGWATSASYEYIHDEYYGGSAWDNQAMFAFDGTPLESLNVYQYAVNGTVGPRELDGVIAPELSVADGDTITLPSSVKVRYTDGVTETQDVTWTYRDGWIQGPGTYTVRGVTSAGVDATATVTVLPEGGAGTNVVVNGGFEDGVAPWTGSGNGYTISAADDPYDNSKRSLHFYSANPVKFTVQQTVSGLAPGQYRMSAQAQGRAGDQVVISASSGISTVSATATLDAWTNWQNPTTAPLSVAADGTAVVSIAVDAAAGAWGTVDEVILAEVVDSEPVDTAALSEAAEQAAAIDLDGYTAVSALAVRRGLDRADLILGSPEPSQASADAATAALADAVDGLTEGDSSIPDPSVRPVTVSVVDGDEIGLPATVTVVAYDDSTSIEAVTWHDVLDLIDGPGEYTVYGESENGWPATATVTVTARNWIVNGGFEAGVDDPSPWVIEAGDTWPSADDGTAWVAAYGDLEGSYALNGWSNGAAASGFWISAKQSTATLPAGTYALSARSAGGGADGASDTTYELGAWDGTSTHTDTLALPGWPDHDEASVTFTLAEPSTADVWVSADLVPGDWSYVDDVRLVRVEQSVGDTGVLAEALAAAADVDRAAYTEDSLARLDLAAERGALLMVSQRSTQDQVESAVHDLAFATTTLAYDAEPICEISYKVNGRWPGGFNAQVWIANVSDENIDGWDLSWSFAGGETITNLWSGTEQQSGGDVTVEAMPWNSVIRPGKKLTFGFIGAADDARSIEEFVLNHSACAATP
ncbi:glycosyl hydrolase 53 family protein [Demequina sp. NBRC 110055]|uniref:glycosyl hydrolase 53 family protein n=1 Tax=Demequina sp. NBRC 110055 TaxID=1570344 RepID=UPI0011867943|nr:glycosyl hydrolase 53 family protein [Demequina sp. NBRC 110055]